MIRFECDYAEGAHPKVLELMNKTNMEQTAGYGMDEYCQKAEGMIKDICNYENLDVHFLMGGTQANKTVIASILKPYQGVVCVDTGHINVHETGAVEATGHKVLCVPGHDGKMGASQIREIYRAHVGDENHEHVVQPGMVYISNPTECGTIYKKKELAEIHEVCKNYGLPLFIDGARLGYGLASSENDITMEDMARMCDVFYIGGTKQGALFGEAVVIINDALKRNFRYMMKQEGAMLAKGRLLGIQFAALLENNLYFELSKKADQLAMEIKEAFLDKGYELFVESDTNQQFPILPHRIMAALGVDYAFCFWEKVDEGHSAVRFCTSWATKEEDVKQLIEDIPEK
ncbi:MAG: aminotransferase class V-fold PLP-dependent enzyme [Anaerostipes sp.]|nr:aminotransferase class V-fold PLP-dependent enzyme [Anaerostipes sp.]